MAKVVFRKGTSDQKIENWADQLLSKQDLVYDMLDDAICMQAFVWLTLFPKFLLHCQKQTRDTYLEALTQNTKLNPFSSLSPFSQFSLTASSLETSIPNAFSTRA